MTLAEILGYIEGQTVPKRFGSCVGDMYNYALIANGMTYIQRAVKDDINNYIMLQNVSGIADYLNLLVEGGIFVDLLSDKEVYKITMLLYQRRGQGRMCRMDN